MPLAGWRQVGRRVVDEIADDHVVLLAAGVAFYLLLALFPALVAGITVYGLVADPADITQQIREFRAVLPAGVVELLTTEVAAIATSERATAGVGLALAALLAVWSASAGLHGLVKAVNTAYDEHETRGFLRLRGISLALTAGGILLGALTLALLVGVPAVVRVLDLGPVVEATVRWGRWPLLLVVFSAALAVVYRVAPDRERARWRWVSWGAGLGSLVWIAGSALFTLYTASLAQYGETYGSFASVVVLMLWLFITAFAILVGAELNAELEHQTVRDTTTGPPGPMGRRGARVADVPPEEPLRAHGGEDDA